MVLVVVVVVDGKKKKGPYDRGLGTSRMSIVLVSLLLVL